MCRLPCRIRFRWWPAGGTTSIATRTDVQLSVLSLINEARRDHGLRPLKASRALARAAAGHARSMARLGFFAHESADGTTAGERLRRAYGGAQVGETLLWRSPDVTPVEALRSGSRAPAIAVSS